MDNQIKLELEYWDRTNESIVTESGFRYRSSKSQLIRIETLVGTLEEIFTKFDSMNNSLRYCNGSYYKFKEESRQNEYIKWYEGLSESTKFNMYYGNGVVD